MKKKLVILIIVILILSSCSASNGITELEATYNKELAGLQNTLNQVQSDLLELEEDKATLETSVVELEQQLEAVVSENMTLEEEVITLTAELLEATESSNTTPSVIATAEIIVVLLQAEDFVGLADFVHPTLGLRFTPYPYIDVMNDLVMTPTQVADFGTDTTVYTWGNYDGSGDVIQLTPIDYYASFIYNEDYANPEAIMWNGPIGTGNMINNMSTAYTTADYVEFHFSGFDPQYAGMDWSSLTLVFEQSGSDWYLVGVVHGQWTI